MGKRIQSAVRRFALTATIGLLFTSGAALAQSTATSSAFGETININLAQSGGAVRTIQSGPIPTLTSNAPPAVDLSDSSPGVGVADDVLGAILQTGQLTVRTTSGIPTTNTVSAEAVMNTTVLTLVDLLTIQMDTLRSSASVGGTCGSTLTATGTTTSTNARSEGRFGTGSIASNPAPNTVLVNSGGIRVVLNEQILSGNGLQERTLTVNAIRITLTNATIDGVGVLNGQIILGQSTATLRCTSSATSADVSITKTAAPSAPAVGQPLTYTLTVSNAGPNTADAVTVSDTLPSQVTVNSVTASVGTCTSTTSSVSCNLLSLASGASATVTITTTTNTAGNAVNTATVSSSTSDPNTANNTATVTTSIGSVPAPIISVTKVAGTNTVTRGQPLQYNIEVRNSGNAPSASLTLTDAISPTATVAAVSSTRGNCTTVSPVTCGIGVLDPGELAIVTIVVVPNAVGTLTNTAVVGALTSTVTTSVLLEGESELSLSKTASAASGRVGQSLTYTIVVTNTGATAANNVTVTDAIAAGATLSSASSSQGTCSSTSPVSCNVGTLAPAGSATITIAVVPNAAGALVNTAVSGTRSSSVVTNITSGVPTPPVSITKTAAPLNARVGDTLTYTIIVRNNASTTATNVVVSDVIATPATLGTVSTTLGTCTSVSPVTCTIPSLAPGATATITIAVTPTAAGALTNTATVADQRATVVNNISSNVPFAKEIVFPVASRTAGARGSFFQTDLRIVNNGSSPANVTLEWYPFSAAGTSGPERVRQVTVQPGSTAIYDEVLRTVLDVSGNGSLRLLSDSTAIEATSRIYNRQQDGCLTGTFGSAFDGQELADFQRSGTLLLLSNEDGEERIRTNLGYFNDSTQAARVTFRAFSVDGRLLGSKTLDLPPFANAQRNIFDVIDTVSGSDRQQPDFYVHFESEGGMPFIYASAVYNSSNDGLIILPVPGIPTIVSAAREIVFPISSQTPGARGSFFRTDLRIVNQGLTPATVTLQWYPFSPFGRTAPERTRQVIVEAGRVAVLNEVLLTILGVSGNGSLRLITDSVSVDVALRIYNTQQDGCLTGTFGAALNGQDPREAVTRGVLTLLSNELGNDAGIRTNLGYFNDSSQPSQVTFRAFAADGRLLGTKTLTLAPFANEQRNIFDLIDTVTSADRQQRDITVQFEASGGLPFIYASAVYNSSNDGLIILPLGF